MNSAGAIASMLATFAMASTAAAGTHAWINPSGGLFDDPSNWQTMTPGPADDASFGLAQTYEVQFSQSKANRLLRVRGGDVTFSLAGFTYALNGTTSEAVFVGDAAADVATMRVLNGTVTTNGIRLGNSSGSQGTLHISGPRSVLSASGNVNVGYFGLGSAVIENGGTLNTANGLIGVTGDGVATISGVGSRWINTGNLFVGSSGLPFIDTLNVIAAGRVISPSLEVGVSGRLAGDGIIESNVSVKGSMAPGGVGQQGILTIQGAYTQGGHSQANMAVELGGTMPGAGYDVLSVSGAANLDRTLAVSLISGFTPPPGSVFDVLVAGSVQGAFTLLNLPSLPEGSFTVQYLSDRVRLIAPGRAVLGDATGDSLVNVSDLLAVINAWGVCPGGATCPADQDHNGAVNVTDLLIVINHWN